MNTSERYHDYYRPQRPMSSLPLHNRSPRITHIWAVMAWFTTRLGLLAFIGLCLGILRMGS